jgi:nitrogen fixation/metabolism regulation signal transduction histidine kinase
MVFKRFRINFIVRTLLLSATIFLFFYLFFATNLTMTLLMVGLLVIFQVFSMFHYVDRTNRVLNNFLESIRYSDFTRTFEVEGLDSSFDRLKHSFNEVIKDFQAVRAEKEENFRYLHTVIQHIGIALIAFQKDGSIELINNATKKLFQVRQLSNVKDLNSFSAELVHKLMNIRHGENSLLKINDVDDILQLAIYATEFTIHNRTITLVSIKNIQQELEEKEMESWQKLIQVLTHEIMNSIAPISSLSATISGVLRDLGHSMREKGVIEEEAETIDDIEQSLQTIYKRADGLMHFVNTYRDLTKIPTPMFSIFSVRSLLEGVMSFMDEEAAAKGIRIEMTVEPVSLELSADEKLIEQVIINLVKNAIQALDNRPDPTIRLIGFLNKRGRITIQVIDNGQGIMPNVVDKIFVPFFTTKAQGSGIGLSLSRQILRLHGGTISVWSIPDKETQFTLTF